MAEEYDEVIPLCDRSIAIKGMLKFSESKKDAMNMLRNYCPENFYSGAKCFCEMKALEPYPKWQQCTLCWMQEVE